MAYYTYILKSLKNDKHYVGWTSNLEERLKKHNAGANRSTRFSGPYEMIFFKEFGTKTEAYAYERKIKSYKGGSAFKKLVGLA